MKIIHEDIKTKQSDYPLKALGEACDLLFMDIETTGFSARHNSIYAIGTIDFPDGENGRLTQYFAESPRDEAQILDEFFLVCREKKTLVHFNGNTFDLPFLKQRAAHFSLSHPLDEMKGIDIFRRTAPYKKILGLEHCKQKDIEAFLGIGREDEYNGGQLIKIYEDYCKTGDAEAEKLLLLHNHDDMIGMLKILPILSYSDVFAHLFKVSRVQANHYEDPDHSEHDELLMKLRFPVAFPKPLSLRGNGCIFSGEGHEGFLKIPLYKEEMKFFYADYKNYYYLPEEDTAIHKAIAFCVDKEHRRQAKASDCYTRKEGAYLPEWDIIFEPIFKRDYQDPVCYFELTDDMKTNPEIFRKYAVHILDMLSFGSNA